MKISSNKLIEIYTDGACSGNPGPGGWGAIILYNNDSSTLSGGEKLTTNNRMEITAVIKSLEIIEENSEIKIYTDSKYVINGITNWIKSWKENDWISSNKKVVKNVDLWKNLELLVQKKIISWQWVKGHSGNEMNEKVDKIARNELNNL
tara:strand:+ start:238 stop:684 length:447 start_codon:yes stop_codon:yes gene_type:complete